MANPLVSVVMPTFNYGRFIGEAIESVLGQTYPHFELVVIDDASTDDTLDIVEGFEDERIVIIRRSDCTGSGDQARNDGLAVARGELIATADADDINLPDRLARQVAFFEAHPEVDILGGAMVRIDEQGNRIGGIWRNPSYEDPREARRALLKCKLAVFNPTMMYRRRVLEKVPGYADCACGGDLEFMMRASRYFRFYNLQDVLVYNRVHPDSNSRAYGRLLIKHYRQIFKIREFLWMKQNLERLQQTGASSFPD